MEIGDGINKVIIKDVLSSQSDGAGQTHEREIEGKR
jgi:hypothetical protein